MTDLPTTRRAGPSLGKLRIAAPIVVALLTLLVYLPSVSYKFVDWDDPVEVLNNPHIESFSPANVRWMFTDFERVRRYQPLDWVSWAINYQLDDRNPAGYHLGNVLQHAACSVLLYFFLLKLLQAWRGNRRTSALEKHPLTDPVLIVSCALGALAWSLHPLRAESVVWVTGRIYTQCAMFLLGCLLCYVHAVDPAAPRMRRRILYVLSVFLFICSLLSYATIVGAAVALLLIDIYPLGRFPGSAPGRWFNRRAIGIYLEKVPYLLSALAIGLITLWARVNAKGMWTPPATLQQFGLFPRIMQAFYSLFYYLWIPFRPVHLLPVYTRLVGFDPTDPIFFLSAAAVIAITILALLLRKRFPWVPVAWGFHILMLVPYLGLTEVPHYTNDRYAHMQEFWMAALLAGLLAYLFARFGPAAFRGAVICCSVLVLALGVLSYLHGAMWSESEQFFQTMIVELGNDPYRSDIYWRLGDVYSHRGQIREALQAFDQSIEANPKAPMGWQLKAALLEKLADSARSQGIAADQYRPIYREAAQAYDGLARVIPTTRNVAAAGSAYAEAGDIPAALERLEAVVAVVPQSAEFRLRYAQVLAAAGKLDQANQQLDAAIKLDPALESDRKTIIASWPKPSATSSAPSPAPASAPRSAPPSK